MAKDAALHFSQDSHTVYCRYGWTSAEGGTLSSLVNNILLSDNKHLTIDGAEITRMDSMGAWFLQTFIGRCEEKGMKVVLQAFDDKHTSLLTMVKQRFDDVKALKPEKRKSANWFEIIGKNTVSSFAMLFAVLSFIGELFHLITRDILKPGKMPWRTILTTIDEMGYAALPIVALLSFLIGVVLTYQMGLQLKVYGANIFIVNLSSMAMLREFAPLITAVIVAGRTGSSFTAQLGTMKLREEIDALYTMGVSPLNRLVLPRIIGLVIAMPLLTLWACAFGMLGSMVMSSGMLDISFYNFVHRFREVTELKTLTIGLSKAPVFALLISVIGCFHGFLVSSSADSIGKKTTQSVVRCIFMIIIADAIFSIIYSVQGI